ncbi:nuclear transport factor 2 family protein [uncultured Dokdonia sp.]|uniref:nuclear transport factor 2 family protein n=1 Tax=uncultured Dokdonia sp. TaxID=575653 RepID=UPI002626D1AE|nr:nuclear transport factor 2 family protein [uncultured Dokdonia sp.]
MKEVIQKFYTAFAAKDPEKMIECYHKDIHFEDPAFGVLTGEKPGQMWRMLCASQKDKEFLVTFSDITYDTEKGTAHWEAVYHFSKTGRKVHNKIDATFEFKDGLISKHVDTFNLHKWAGQALGFKGKLIGGTSFFKNKLQAQTNKALSTFITKQNT